MIKDKTGFSVDNAIRVNTALATEDEKKEEPAEKTRKSEPVKVEEKKVRKYNITTTK
jgi:hypothetical protein